MAGRNFTFLRLNRSPKHRWSMLRNMAASLFLHERITTTEAKAKCLVPFVNRIFSTALKTNKKTYNKIHGWLRIQAATRKLLQDVIIRFPTNKGGVVRSFSLEKRRKGDNAKMTVVELLNNPYKEKEDAEYEKLRKQSQVDFCEWELFTRINNLKMLVDEKEKRDLLYSKLTKNILENKAGRIQSNLFGNNFAIHELKTDPLLPNQHMINYYLKAAKSKKELDNFYKKSDSYLKHLITQAKSDLERFKEILNNSKKRKQYEKRHFKKYYESIEREEEEEEEEKDSVKNEEKEKIENERIECLNQLAKERVLDEVEETINVSYYEKIFKYMEVKGYRIDDLSIEQLKDIEMMKFKLEKEDIYNKVLRKAEEDEYVKILKSNKLTKRNSDFIDSYNKEKKLEKSKIYRPVLKDNHNSKIENAKYLTKEEINESNPEIYRMFVKDPNKIKALFESEKEKKELDLMRKLYEKNLKSYLDRQVKKKKKPTFSELVEYKDKLDLKTKEKEAE